jgi:hypothetical protein
MEFAHEAGEMVKAYPHAAVGIHWNLTLGRPLSPAREVSSLVNDDGLFFPFGEFRKRLKDGRIFFKEVQLELTRQTESIKETLGDIAFWNTHQNAHLWPRLFQLCVDLALKSEIRRMRSNSRITLAANRFLFNMKNFKYMLKGMILQMWTHSAHRKGVLTPDGLIALPGAGAGKGRLEEYLRQFSVGRSPKTVEATLHPASDENDTYRPIYGKLQASRFEEYLIYSDPDLKERFSKLSYECISYKHLK